MKIQRDNPHKALRRVPSTYWGPKNVSSCYLFIKYIVNSGFELSIVQGDVAESKISHRFNIKEMINVSVVLLATIYWAPPVGQLLCYVPYIHYFVYSSKRSCKIDLTLSYFIDEKPETPWGKQSTINQLFSHGCEIYVRPRWRLSSALFSVSLWS